MPTGQPDAGTTGYNGGNNTTLATTITTIADNTWVVGFSPNFESIASSSTTNITSRDASNNWIIVGDSNAVIHPAGNYIMTENTSSTADIYWNMLSLAPFIASGAKGYKSLLGVGQG